MLALSRGRVSKSPRSLALAISAANNKTIATSLFMTQFVVFFNCVSAFNTRVIVLIFTYNNGTIVYFTLDIKTQSYFYVQSYSELSVNALIV